MPQHPPQRHPHGLPEPRGSKIHSQCALQTRERPPTRHIRPPLSGDSVRVLSQRIAASPEGRSPTSREAAAAARGQITNEISRGDLLRPEGRAERTPASRRLPVLARAAVADRELLLAHLARVEIADRLGLGGHSHRARQPLLAAARVRRPLVDRRVAPVSAV